MIEFAEFWGLLQRCSALRNDDAGCVMVMTADGVAQVIWSSVNEDQNADIPREGE